MATIQERFARCLSLLRRLQRGPADRETLIDHVRDELGPGYYVGEGRDRSIESQFSQDIKFLREKLAVQLPSYDRTSAIYELEGFGEFRPLGLSDIEVDALAFLLRTFSEGVPQGEAVQKLLRHVVNALTKSQQEELHSRRQRFQLDLRRRDEKSIHPEVEAAVDRAITQRRVLRFAYRTPSQADDIARVHTVMPYTQTFDPVRGHLYLDAYWLTSDGPYGLWKQERWQLFRMDYMLADDELEVLPSRLPPELPPRKFHRLEYWLSPRVARLGQATRHFDAMDVHETDGKGWVRITAATDNLFRACQLLLGYGPNCRVVGGADARREMETLVQEMAKLY